MIMTSSSLVLMIARKGGGGGEGGEGVWEGKECVWKEGGIF